MTDRKAEIKEILFRNDRTVKWLSSKMPGVDFYYLLGDYSKTFDADLYDQIKELFKKEGLIASTDDRCTQLIDQMFHLDGLIGHALIIMNTNVRDFTKDNVLDFNERTKLSKMLDKIEVEITNEIGKSRKIIEGR